jgi:hypothetical protein
LEDLDLYGAASMRRLTAPGLFDGPINGDAYIAYVEQILAPTLQKGGCGHHG